MVFIRTEIDNPPVQCKTWKIHSSQRHAIHIDIVLNVHTRKKQVAYGIRCECRHTDNKLLFNQP